MNKTVTQWFDGDPPCAGIWERKPSGLTACCERRFAYWDGKRFTVWSDSPNDPNIMIGGPSCLGRRKWRGLAEKPEGAK